MQSLSLSPPIILDHSHNNLRQRIALRNRKVGLLILGENRQNKDRQVHSAKQIDNSGTAALAASAETKAYFANASAAGNDYPARRLRSQPIHNGLALVRRKQAFCVSQIGRRFN